MVRIHGKLTSLTSGAAVENHAVLANLRFVPGANGGDEAGTLAVPVSGSARTGADGQFRIEIDAEGTPRGPVEVLVSAPNGVLAHRTEVALDVLPEPLEIRIDPAAPFTVDESDLPGLGQRLRVAGRVIDEAGRDVPAGLPVVLWVVDEPEGPPRPVLVTQTHANGAFGGDWPPDQVTEAFGRVSGGLPIPVPLDEASRIVREILLVTRIGDAEDKQGECGCGQAPPRAPDAVDLTTNPDAFSQDLGGGCIDLTVPNRALEEFSYYFVVRTSEPRVQGLTLGARRTVPRDLLVDLLGASLSATALRGGRLASATLGRADLQLDVDSARHLVRGDAAPRPEAIERAAWLSGVSHAKGQIDAAQRTRSSRQPLDADSAIDWDGTPTLYPAIEIAHGHVLHYREVWRADGYSLGDLLYSLPLAPGQRRQIAVVDWERRDRAAREESLEFEEALDAVIERDRDVREIVGSDLRETTSAGSRNTTWGVAAGIGGGLIGSGFGLFGGIAGGASGSDTQAWQRSARQFSADSQQQLRDRVGQRASSVRSERSTVVQAVAQGETVRAVTEVVANYNRCHAITVAYFEVLRHFLVTHELADVQECLFVPFPIRVFDRGKALRWREALGRFLADRSLARGFDAIERIADDWVGWDFPESRYSEEAPRTLEGELRVSFVLPRPRDTADGSFQVAEWEAYRDVLPFFSRDVFGRLIEKAAAANLSATAARDEAFQREVAPQIATRLVNRLRFAYVGSDGGETEVPLDATLVSGYRENHPLYVTLQPAGDLPGVPREDIAYFKIEYTGTALPPEAQVIVHNGRLRYSTDHLTALLFDDPRILDDLRGGDPVLVATPTSRRELRNPREEDREIADRLVAHLNDHLEHFHQVLWHSLDAQRRYMLLDALEVPGQQGRSVASLCTNELLGIVGNSLVLPVAPGQRLNPAVIATDAEGRPVEVRHAYATPPSPALRISVPTRGVYAEAVAGACSACEPIDDTRYWRWSTEGLLAPPEIQPVDTGTRASPPTDLTPAPLPAPLVSIQTAPDAPDPFGLAAAFGLLAKPDLFRDITGLEGTQKNAIGAFDAALSAASAIGGEAAKLARQQELAQSSERMLDRIQQAAGDGLLTPEAAKRLTESVLGGLAGRDEPAAGAPAEDGTVEKAVDQLAQAESGSLKVETPSETVEVSFDDALPAVGGAGQPVTHPPLAAPHDSTDVPVMVEARFDGRPPSAASPDAGDVVPFVMDELDLLLFALAGQSELTEEVKRTLIAELVQARVLQPVAGNSQRYRLHRPLHIVYPAAGAQTSAVAGSSRLPVVVLLHGAHDPLAPLPNQPGRKSFVESARGYQYLQDELAGHGIVSVSVDANAAGFFEPALVEMRARFAISALDTLRALDGDRGSVFHGRLDFSRVGLFGHSRGGDAMVRAARIIATQRREYKVKLVCALSPSDATGRAKDPAQRLALTRGDTPFFAVLYGAQDGDMAGHDGARDKQGTGFRHYDRAQTDKSMVFLDGCSHNRFNSVWMQDVAGKSSADEFGVHPDDAADPNVIRPEATHQELLKEYVGALARWHLLGDVAGKALFDGSRPNRQGIGASVQWSFGSQVLPVDDMENPQAPRELHDATIDSFADTRIGSRTLAGETSHQTNVLTFEPGVGGVAPALVLDLPSALRNWLGFDRLTLRATALFDLASGAAIAQGRLPEIEVLLHDAGPNTLTLARFLAARFPQFHRGFNRIAGILSTAPGAAGETVLETKGPHGLASGDVVKIEMDRDQAAVDPATLALNGVHTVTRRDATHVSIPVGSTGNLGKGRLGRLENLSVHRLETFSHPIPRLPANHPFQLNDVRKLEIRPATGFPQHTFIDSIELIKD